MPTAAPRACPVPGCASLVTRDRPCPAHVRQPWAGAGRGSTRRWRERRLWVLKDSPLCVACQAEGRVALATEIDHVVPVARGGTDDYTNLQPLCTAHHRAKTQREQRRGGT